MNAATTSRWTRERKLRAFALAIASLFLVGLLASVLGGGL